MIARARSLTQLALLLAAVSISPLPAQTSTSEPPPAATSTPATPPVPPATKLAAFAPKAGAVVYFGYDNLPGLFGVSIDVRELRSSDGPKVRGVRIDIRESQYRESGIFVDQDELPDLIKGIDALLEITTNPTTFKQFEVRYTTKDEFRVTAYNTARNEIEYVVTAGRTLPARRAISSKDLLKIRESLVLADQRLKQP